MIFVEVGELKAAPVIPVEEIRKVAKANLAILEMARRRALENDALENTNAV